jgi:PD-(D/E)XK endonuclease
VISTKPIGSPHRRERAVNRRAQGDIGEFSAMEWLARKGALVWIPLGHSPHVDLVAELDERLLRVQVKTCTYQPTRAPDRWHVSIATSGGNQSWNGASKTFDRSRVDYLFVLVGDGRRWFIPASAVESARAIALGGPKYSEFEIARGSEIDAIVHPEADLNKLRRRPSGECQSGQMEQTVNLPAMPTQVRILPPPSPPASAQILFRPKRQATIPKRPCEEAGIRAGDRLRVKADGPGRVVLERIDRSAAEPMAQVESA